jgi:hypothetical protein
VTQRPESLALLRHLAGKPGHDEVKSDFRQLLVAEFDVALADIRFEQRVEVKSRIDALIGRTVFEAKRDLASEMRDVERKMPDYLANREAETGEPFVGIASDGRRWVVLALEQGALVTIKETVLDPEKSGEFLAWLDGALALKISLPPDPQTARIELGADSVAFRAADKALRALWNKLKIDTAVSLKRQLWAQLLKIVYGRDADSDALWLQHSYLVIVAKCIALAVLGMKEDDPARLLSGEALASAGITGAVESDFFDWVVADAEGVKLVRQIMAHVRRFRLAEVESDVLKVLYESLIDRTERHGLGEYYTPDWLAAKIVKHVVDRPVEQRVFDPACGSGTFLFHAIRAFLADAEEGDMAADRTAFEASQHVAGMDIHPVAVIIARVTYLLALAPVLAKRAGAIYVPVYLGDAMQLSISEMIGGRELTIRVPPPAAGEGQGAAAGANGKDQLEFPDTFCRDPGLFDKAVERMRSGSEQSMSREQIEKALYRITEQHYRADVTREQQLAIEDLGKTRHIRQATPGRPRFRLGLCRAQSLAPAGVFGRRGLGERDRRQPALGRVPPHEPRLAETLQGIGERAGRLRRRQAGDAERSLRIIHRSLGDALSARVGPHRFRSAAGCADARAIRTPALRRLSLGVDPVGRSVDDGRQRAAVVPGPLLRRVRSAPRDREGDARDSPRLFGHVADAGRAGGIGRSPLGRLQIHSKGKCPQASSGAVFRRFELS